MKTILVFFSIFTVSICSAHITNDYPFKTFLDSYNNLYIAGYEKNKTHQQIKIQKIINPNNSGGMMIYNPSFYLTHGQSVSVIIQPNIHCNSPNVHWRANVPL